MYFAAVPRHHLPAPRRDRDILRGADFPIKDFDWRTLTIRRAVIVRTDSTSSNGYTGHRAAPAGMVDAEFLQCVVLNGVPLSPAPGVRRVGGASEDAPTRGRSGIHVGWECGTIGYHGGRKNLQSGSGRRSDRRLALIPRASTETLGRPASRT